MKISFVPKGALEVSNYGMDSSVTGSGHGPLGRPVRRSPSKERNVGPDKSKTRLTPPSFRDQQSRDGGAQGPAIQPGRSVLTVNSVWFIRFQEISVFQTQEPIGWSENKKPISSVSVFNSVFRFLTEQTDGRNQKFNVHNNTRHTSKSMAGNLTRAACAAIPIQSPSPRRSLPSSRCPCPRPRPQPWSRHHPAALVGHPATGICGRGHAAGPLQLGEWRC